MSALDSPSVVKKKCCKLPFLLHLASSPGPPLCRWPDREPTNHSVKCHSALRSLQVSVTCLALSCPFMLKSTVIVQELEIFGALVSSKDEILAVR